MLKTAFFKVKGMQRDLSVSAFNPNYSYENRNIRITNTEDSTLMSISNEKGNSLANLNIENEFSGIPIGCAEIKDSNIIFVCSKDKLYPVNIEASGETINDITAAEEDCNIESTYEDRIYRLWYDEDILNTELLYSGDLGFNYKYPIEALSIYENEKIQKVYWTDNLNIGRVINIADTKDTRAKYNPYYFDFSPSISLGETTEITRLSEGGNFPQGVIQYAFTYCNKYMQETNIFYTSPIYYISHNERGASPEESVSCAFDIFMYNLDTKFDYVNIYSIQRTSINSTPSCKFIGMFKINKENTTIYKEVMADLGKEYNIGDCDDIRNIWIERYGFRSTSLYNTGSWIKSDTIPELYYKSAIPFTRIVLEDGSIISTGDSSLDYDTPLDTCTISGYPQGAPSTTYKWKDLKIESYNHNLHKLSEVSQSISNFLRFTDSGNIGITIDPTELLYKGSEPIIFKTFTQKDNTLFIGNFSLDRKYIDKEIKTQLKNITEQDIENVITDSVMHNPKTISYYSYEDNLKYNSSQIKSFKYLEHYRLGLQFQHRTGKWSEVVWVGDYINNKHIEATYRENDVIRIPIFKCTYNINNPEIRKIISLGYVRIRPVIVYPSQQDRLVVCQGMVCPTVYNAKDRYENAPYVQSSWFARPFAPFEIEGTSTRKGNNNNTMDYQSPDFIGVVNMWDPIDTGQLPNPSAESLEASIINSGTNRGYYTSDIIQDGNDISTVIPFYKYGSWKEFRPFHILGLADTWTAEIAAMSSGEQSTDNKVPSDLTTKWKLNLGWLGFLTSTDNINKVLQNRSECYYVDQSIFTLHSPEIEFEDVVNIEDLKFRIIGAIPLDSFFGDISISASGAATATSGNNAVSSGFKKQTMSAVNSIMGYRSLGAGPFWEDYKSNIIYPFNMTKIVGSDTYSVIESKKISNVRYSINTTYLEEAKIWSKDITGAKIFNSNEITALSLKAPKYLNTNNIIYYGNVDKIVTNGGIWDTKIQYPRYFTGGNSTYGTTGFDSWGFISTDGTYYAGRFWNHDGNAGSVMYHSDNEGIEMKYKTPPHAVMALEGNSGIDGAIICLPTAYQRKSNNDSTKVIMNILPNVIHPTSGYIPTEEDCFYTIEPEPKKLSSHFMTPAKIEAIDVDIHPVKTLNTSNLSEVVTFPVGRGWLWMGELYRDKLNNAFGGTTEDALANNEWISCGDPIPLLDRSSNEITVIWKEGDTYYQRYDCIKSYPYTLEDRNCITDIVSFMVETRINLDGRYDKQRGILQNLAITSENMPQVNTVYSQNNNFFNYTTLNSEAINIDKFTNTILWSKTKTLGEDIDTWCNVTVSSTLDLDGSKGEIQALRKRSNDIVALQEKALEQILYNESTQLSTVEGVPVEISNSGKVYGHRRISDVGTQNKWSVCETPSGIYFIDNITDSIYLLNEQLLNLTSTLGFNSWMRSNKKDTEWNPVDFDNFVTYQDRKNNSIYFIDKDYCLSFSEPLGQFESFLSYEGTPYFINTNKGLLSIHNSEYNNGYFNIWEQNTGDYNMYFGKFQPFSVTYIVNPTPTSDKIFNTVEFRSDTWDDNNLINSTFDTLDVWNEYQKGTVKLSNILGKPSSLKRKFRIWRANIPRDESNGRDRIRNPWVYIKLARNEENTYKTILHDVTVGYFE